MSELARALEGDLEGWSGLPAGVDEQSLRAAVEADWQSLPDYQERGASRYRVLASGPLRAFFPGDATAALWVETEDPEVDPQAVIAALGEAPHVFSSRRTAAGATTSEHVWPERGVALVVASPIDGGAARTAHLALFVAMSFEEYLTSAGVAPAIRPYPL